jgi:outer membrane protein assembly factor BamB
VGKVRWWPAAAVLGLGASWLGRVWLLSDTIRQEKVVRTVATSGGILMLLLLWLLLLSGLPGRVRAGGLAVFLLVAGGAAALVRVRGVTGDLVPILEPRWAAREAAAPEARVPRPTVDSMAPAPSPAARPSSAPGGPAAGDYPQFLGPERNGVVRGLRLARDWSARPPRRLWRQPIGAGWSGFAVAGSWAVTQEQHGEDELVVAYELRTGKVRWRHADRARYSTVIAGEGPRATPTVSGDQVFTLGATGLLNALDVRTGQRLWRRDVLKDNGAESPPWGKSGSPLVLDGRVIVSAGGPAGKSLVAYDRETGAPVWSGGDDGSGYSSPMLAELAGRRQVLIFNQRSVAAHDPESGSVLWEHAWPGEQPNVSQPLPLSADRVLVSAGYGVGSKVFAIAKADDGALNASLVWESPRLKAKFTNLVLHRGYVYGLDDGVLACLDPATGQQRWKAGRYGHGQVILVEDLLLVQTEEGEVVLVDPNPSSLVELTRFAALEGKTWNPPALAGPILLVRNDLEAAAYELPLAQE